MPADLAVTDTHALVWYATGGRRKLGRRALGVFERAEAGRAAIYVPTVCLVEISELVHLGRIELGSSFEEWEDGLFGSGRYFAADLTREVVRGAERLFLIPERVDRLIAATASYMELPLISRDRAIAGAAGVELIW